MRTRLDHLVIQNLAGYDTEVVQVNYQPLPVSVAIRGPNIVGKGGSVVPVSIP